MSESKMLDPVEPLNTGEADSFANRTVRTRLPTIISAVATNDALKRFVEEVRDNHPVGAPTVDAEGGDGWKATWAAQKQALGHTFTWHAIPWFWAEAFMFRRILELSGYFSTGADPFLHQKMEEVKVRQCL